MKFAKIYFTSSSENGNLEVKKVCQCQPAYYSKPIHELSPAVVRYTGSGVELGGDNTSRDMSTRHATIYKNDPVILY